MFWRCELRRFSLLPSTEESKAHPKKKREVTKKATCEVKNPKQTSNTKKKTGKEICTVDAVVQGDETLGVPTVDPAKGKSSQGLVGKKVEERLDSHLAGVGMPRSNSLEA